MTDDVLKRVLQAEPALRENLLPLDQVKVLHKDMIDQLDRLFHGKTSIPALRYREVRAMGRGQVWVQVARSSYPADSPWPHFERYLALWSQIEAQRTLKRRLSTEDFFIESRIRDEDQHLILGARDGSGEKAHVVIDGETGEIRVEANRQEPTQIAAKIEAILTLPTGHRIRTTRELLEFIGDDED